MQITHNEADALLGAASAAVVFFLGWFLGHKRAYAECCECCTCQLCEGDDHGDEDYDDPLPRLAVAAEDHRTAVPVDSRRPDQDAGGVRPPVEDPGAASLVPGQSRPGSVTEQLPAANKGRPGPGRYPDGRRVGFTYGAGTGYEDEPCAGELAAGRYPDGREYPTAPRIVNPELAALSETAADGPEIDAEARTDILAAVTADRLWLETVLLSWESRYPIHQEA